MIHLPRLRPRGRIIGPRTRRGAWCGSRRWGPDCTCTGSLTRKARGTLGQGRRDWDADRDVLLPHPHVQVELPVRAREVAVLPEEELDLPQAGVADAEVVGLVQFWQSGNVTLNVDQVVGL